jgi:hypothetical protein
VLGIMGSVNGSTLIYYQYFPTTVCLFFLADLSGVSTLHLIAL